MKTMTTQAIREAFLSYFESKQHTRVSSSALIPGNDPSLLFTNAGMVQFKDVFLGSDQRDYDCATSVQRCLRAGGKHNDLENVGYTRRHHTFFEMLGNFSFGAYFKREAIAFAWEFLTKVLEIPAERLWVTVYEEDAETEAIWLDEMGIDPARFSRCGEADNFWSMGETGPCGPCTEIFFDHGESVPGGPPGSPDEDGDRYVEIWNLVFMQFDRDQNGLLTALPKPCVDTGMGLERVAAVMQGVQDNYDIDLFKHLLNSLSQHIDINDISNKSMRVIVDHIRSIAFLIVDGVIPSNEGRGYVLRRIMRRALRHGHQLGLNDAFLYKMVSPLIDIMGSAYPGLLDAQSTIVEVIRKEEAQFALTLKKGMKLFEQSLDGLQEKIIPGDLVFQLYDTYGFPPDLTKDAARERGYLIDQAGFDLAMEKQKAQSKQASQFTSLKQMEIPLSGISRFVGYETEASESIVTGIIKDQNSVQALSEGDLAIIALDQTPFYAESGGQVGDQGLITTKTARFHVQDTQKVGGVILHQGVLLEGELAVDEHVLATVDSARRETALNHTATHLVHEALRQVLGKHVSQKGSLVDPNRLRFDFSHQSALTQDEIQAVERIVNAVIRNNLPTALREMSIDEAKASGAMALFGEKYADTVRVIALGDFSTEICGGLHAKRTGDIGLFKITAQSASSSGVRRIEAVTGAKAMVWLHEKVDLLASLSTELNVQDTGLLIKVQQLEQKQKMLLKQVHTLKKRMLEQPSEALEGDAVEVAGISIIAARIEDADKETLRSALDVYQQRYSKRAVVLAGVLDERVRLVSSVSKDCLAHFTAGELLNHVAKQVGGKGGGRPDRAEGGGDQPGKLAEALDSVVPWVKHKLA